MSDKKSRVLILGGGFSGLYAPSSSVGRHHQNAPLNRYAHNNQSDILP
jgi:NADH dehydrogenase FAD-containing subunit